VSARYERLDFGPGWQATNDNLVELVDLFGEVRLDWTPQPEEWTARTIFAHIIGARYHGPIPEHDEWAHEGAVIDNCGTAEGIKHELQISWIMIARFLSDRARLNAVYDVPRTEASEEPPPPLLGSVERAAAGMDLGYVDEPDQYTGHYIAYHRFAHDLHHRSTLIGYLSQLGVSLDGHRIRPL